LRPKSVSSGPITTIMDIQRCQMGIIARFYMMGWLLTAARNAVGHRTSVKPFRHNSRFAGSRHVRKGIDSYCFPRNPMLYHPPEGGGYATGQKIQATKLAGFIQARSFPEMRRDPTRTKTSSHARGAVGPKAQNGPEGGSRIQAARPAFPVLG
jgi:hypothetical protein